MTIPTPPDFLKNMAGMIEGEAFLSPSLKNLSVELTKVVTSEKDTKVIQYLVAIFHGIDRFEKIIPRSLPIINSVYAVTNHMRSYFELAMRANYWASDPAKGWDIDKDCNNPPKNKPHALPSPPHPLALCSALRMTDVIEKVGKTRPAEEVDKLYHTYAILCSITHMDARSILMGAVEKERSVVAEEWATVTFVSEDCWNIESLARTN